jgi:hypothetical protein
MKNTLYNSLVALTLIVACWQCVGTDPKPEVAETKKEVRDTIRGYCTQLESKPESKSRAVGAKGKYWDQNQTLNYTYMGNPSAAQIARMDSAIARWQVYVNLKFVRVPVGTPSQCRIAWNTGGGSWSYVGRDNASIPQQYQTMNIGFQNQSNSVELHEFGHFLGLYHEHQTPNRIYAFNRPLTYQYFGAAPNYWSTSTVDQQIINAYSASQVDATAPQDVKSIMEYALPGSIFDPPNAGIPGGIVLSSTDKAFISMIYPKSQVPPIDPPITTTNITLTAAQAADLRATSLSAVNTANAAKAAADAHRAKILQYLGQ